jgi:hypothetical protein
MDAIEGMWFGNDASGVLSKPVMVRRGEIGSAGGIVNEAWMGLAEFVVQKKVHCTLRLKCSRSCRVINCEAIS